MEAISTLAQERSSRSRDHALALAIAKLNAADFPAGYDEMVALLEELQRFILDPRCAELAEAWMDRWLEVDTPGALRFLSDDSQVAKLPSAYGDYSGYPLQSQALSGFGGAFRALARRQPEQTRQMLSKMEPGLRRGVGIYALLAEVARGGVAQAQPYLASFVDKEDRRGAMVGYVTGLVSTDIHSGFEVAHAEAPGASREEMLRLVFQHAAERGSGVVSELLERIDDPAARRRQASNAVLAMGFSGRESVLPFIKAESERRASSGEWKADLKNWASPLQVVVTRAEALPLADWALDFAPDTERTMLFSIASSWAYRDPAEFQAWVSKRAGDLDSAALDQLGNAFSHLTSSALDPTRAWANTLPPGPVRDHVRFRVALKSGEEGNVEQAEAAYRSVATSDTKGDLARQLASVLVTQNAATAAEWATGQPPGPARTAALQVVAETWSENDPRGAAQWLDQMPPGTERDSAVRTFASKAVRADPRTAAQWVEQVADPGLRSETAKTVFDRWTIQDPVAARAWLRGLPGVEEDLFAKTLRNLR